jgi:hypothetical protein
LQDSGEVTEPDLGAAWTDAMRGGNFANAWDISDRVLAQRVEAGPNWTVPRHVQRVWDGRDLADRRVLVRCYHGLGDTLQFARFLPQLESIARATLVWAQPSLIPLLQTMRFSGRLLALHDGIPEVDYDVDIELMELAHALRITLESVSAAVPYFDVPPAPRLSERFSIGVVAQPGSWDVSRALPVECLDALRIPNADLFSLQLDSALPGMTDASTSDVLGLASRVRALDLVITADTMLAHLAGALGVRTWILIPADADWRWMAGRTDSPWYPSARLFRQHRPGDWRAVLDDVRSALLCER